MSGSFTGLIGCAVPIQLAGMGGVSTARLAAAVTNAGGLGMLGGAGLGAADLERALAEVGDLTTGPCGVNFLMPFLDRDAVELAARKAAVVEFFYGEPDAELVDVVHAGGAVAGWQVGSSREARAALAAGCDFIVAQGIEAGGHVRGTTPLRTLLAEIAADAPVPVVAAGGIGTPGQVVEALRRGASAVRVGTRLLATRESGAHPRYLSLLVSAGAADTELTECFSVGWPSAPHRVLSSSIVAAHALSAEPAGHVEIGGERAPVPRFAAQPPSVATEGKVEAMALYAGTSVGSVERIESAAEVIEELTQIVPATDVPRAM